jgi:hypothetical protein
MGLYIGEFGFEQQKAIQDINKRVNGEVTPKKATVPLYSNTTPATTPSKALQILNQTRVERQSLVKQAASLFANEQLDSSSTTSASSPSSSSTFTSTSTSIHSNKNSLPPSNTILSSVSSSSSSLPPTTKSTNNSNYTHLRSQPLTPKTDQNLINIQNQMNIDLNIIETHLMNESNFQRKSLLCEVV